MRFLAEEPRSTAKLLFPSQYLCGTILVTQYSMVWDWLVLRAELMHFIDYSHYMYVFYGFPFIFFVLYMGWYYGARVMSLI